MAPAFAQAPQPPSSYYPAPPPEQAPTVQQGAPLTGLSSPLPASTPKIDRTEIASDAEAQLFADARRIVWGRYAKVKGAKPGDVAVTKQGGEVAFRVAKVEKGIPCKVAGVLNFRRSGKSQVWRLAEGDNPCDGARENFDLVYEKSVEKKPVPTQPKRG
jgi:hypothetical protein